MNEMWLVLCCTHNRTKHHSFARDIANGIRKQLRQNSSVPTCYKQKLWFQHISIEYKRQWMRIDIWQPFLCSLHIFVRNGQILLKPRKIRTTPELLHISIVWAFTCVCRHVCTCFVLDF